MGANTDPSPLTVIDLAIEARVGGAGALYTYLWDGRAAIGDAYLAPLGARQVLGYVVDVRTIDPAELGFPVDRLRPLNSRVDGVSLPASIISLVRFVSSEALCPLSVSLGLASPPGARMRLVTTWSRIEGSSTDLPISAHQAEALRVLDEQDGKIEESRKAPLASGSKKALQALVARGLVRRSLSVSSSAEKHRLQGDFSLTPDADKVEKFLKKEAKKKPAQALMLMRLQGAEGTSFTAQELKALSGSTDQTIRALLQGGLLGRDEEQRPRIAAAVQPNAHQQRAIDSIVDAIHAGRNQGFLLFGVTGSGKTEVYLRAAHEALRRGKQVLYLVPEIALTAQVIAQLRARFGNGVAVLHSNLELSDRLENWLKIKNRDALVVLGARSALFAPIEDLGLIIMDEEHEASYKQESTPRYHAKRVAMHLARTFNVPIVLGSATPSIESYYEALKGNLTLLNLPVRAAQAQLPKVQVEDLSELFKEGTPSLLTAATHRALEETLLRGEQAILFLNRRAYAPFIVCRDCGQQIMCPHCSVSLALHRKEAMLRCHQCGHAERAPETCPACQSSRIRPFGAGTQKVEETVAELFPEAKVGRLDRDVSRKKGALEATLASFRSGDLNVLVGTQMVAKGLDFPNVTLVCVIAADVSLGVPDFRASERTFQILSQVAGRAGRAKLPGKVMIQTFNPNHVSITRTVEHDFVGLYEVLIQERKEANYPPFVRLVNIVLSGPSRAELYRLGEDLRVALALELPEAEVLGPTDCALERLNAEWRVHMLLKVAPGQSLEPLEHVVEQVAKGSVKLLVDVDPQSLL